MTNFHEALEGLATDVQHQLDQQTEALARVEGALEDLQAAEDEKRALREELAKLKTEQDRSVDTLQSLRDQLQSDDQPAEETTTTTTTVEESDEDVTTTTTTVNPDFEETTTTTTTVEDSAPVIQDTVDPVLDAPPVYGAGPGDAFDPLP